MMNIVACASDNYTMQCGVMFYSVCHNNLNEEICFYLIMDSQFSDKHKDDIRQTVSAFPNKRVEFVQVTEEQIDSFLQFENPYYTRHVFYRLLMAVLLPRTVDKALYMDCDIIVRHSLNQLFEFDITNYAVGCVHDTQEGRIEQFNRLGYPYEKGYFNSGVLLANLDYWRKKNVTKRFSEFISINADKIVMPDQDVLNYVLQDEKIFLPFTYNLQSVMLWKKEYMYTFEYVKYEKELKYVREDPVILHLSGARPWIKGCDHPYKSEFFKYQSQTMWKDAPLWPKRKSIKTRVIDALRPLGAKLGVCHIIPDYYDRSLKLK